MLGSLVTDLDNSYLILLHFGKQDPLKSEVLMKKLICNLFVKILTCRNRQKNPFQMGNISTWVCCNVLNIISQMKRCATWCIK